MSTQQRQTFEDWLNYLEAEMDAAGCYYGHGTDNGWDEAVHLVVAALDLPYHSGAELLTQAVMPPQQQKILALLKQRIATHKPLPYLTHQAWFAGLRFYVDERVLIPRSPFGEWIERAFQPWVPYQKVNRILEIGTGSGCMAIAAAHAFPDANVVAADISADALEVAAKNVAAYQLQDRISLVKSDCFDHISPIEFDIIMTNPPYVGDDEMATLPAEYQHEPTNALRADDNGLAIINRILAESATYLSDHGILVGEVGNSDQALIAGHPELAFTWLEQQHGGHGVFLLEKSQLNATR